MALTDDLALALWVGQDERFMRPVLGKNKVLSFARAIEAEARRDALEEAAQLVEKSTYRKRWAKAAVNSQPNNVPPCELAAAIRKLKEDIQ